MGIISGVSTTIPFSFDLFILSAFLGITALVGSWGASAKSLQEYVSSDKRWGTGVLIMTVLGIQIGSGTVFGTIGDVYQSGIAGIIATELQLVIPTLIVIYFVAPKIVHFQDCMTTGDLMRLFYGDYARMITGVIAFLYCSFICAGQFIWLKALGEQMGITSSWALVAGVTTLAFYTARSGIRAVIATNMLHFVVAFGVMPLIAHLLLYRSGGLQAILSAFSLEQWRFFAPDALSTIKGTKTATGSLLSIVFPSFALSFPFIQRLLMAKHQQQSVSAYYGVLAVSVFFILLLATIGLAATALYPAQSSSKVLLSIIADLPLVTKGIGWATIVGIIISTADAFLHTASVSLAHDTLKPIADRWGIKVDELSAARYTTFLVGFVSLLLCLADEHISTFVLALHPIGLVFTIPLLAGIMGLKTDKRVFYVSTTITLAAYVFPRLLIQSDLATDIATSSSILASVLSYLGTHLHFNRGFVAVNRLAYGQTTTVWHPSWQGARTTLSHLLPAPGKVVHYFQQKVAEHSARTTRFSMFVACSYMAPIFMHSIGQPEHYNWLLTLRAIGALLCVGLMLKSQWPAWLLYFFSTYYHLTLLFCFPFMTTFLFLLEGGSIVWVMNVMFSITLFIMLLNYVIAILLFLLGIALAVGLYQQAIDPLVLEISPEIQYFLVYSVGFSVAIGVLFSRIREQFLKQANRRLVHQAAALKDRLSEVIAENEEYTRTFRQIEMAKKLLNAIQQLQTMQHLIDTSSSPPTALLTQQQQALQANLLPLFMQLKDLAMRGQDHLRLHIEQDLPIDQFLLSLQEKLLPRGIDVPLLTERKTQQQKINVDAEQLTRLLVKGIASLQWLIKDTDQYLLLGLEDTYLSYPLPALEEDYMKQVPALRITLTATEQLPPLAASYRPDLTNFVPEGHQAFQAMEEQADRRLIKAHYGYTEVGEDTLIYVIPVDVSEVRSKDMDKPELALGALSERADPQEQAFLEEVEAKSEADLGVVKLALNLIKWYHRHKKRHTEEPCYLHSMAVAQIVLDYDRDESAIVGALLHDMVEDTPMLLEHIEAMFGKKTAEVVDVVTQLQSIKGSMYKIKLSAEENLKMLSNSENKRGLYVKLADRMHNMRTINDHTEVSKRKLVAQETMDFFVPLAEKLGLQQAAQEFKERCNAVINKQEIS